jgi:hypothetical protein
MTASGIPELGSDRARWMADIATRLVASSVMRIAMVRRCMRYVLIGLGWWVPCALSWGQGCIGGTPVGVRAMAVDPVG